MGGLVAVAHLWWWYFSWIIHIFHSTVIYYISSHDQCVKIRGERGCWELHDFSTPSDPHSLGSWQEPTPIEKSHNCQWVNLGVQEPLGLWPRGSWTLTVPIRNYAIFNGYEFLLYYHLCTIIGNVEYHGNYMNDHVQQLGKWCKLVLFSLAITFQNVYPT